MLGAVIGSAVAILLAVGGVYLQQANIRADLGKLTGRVDALESDFGRQFAEFQKDVTSQLAEIRQAITEQLSDLSERVAKLEASR